MLKINQIIICFILNLLKYYFDNENIILSLFLFELY